MNKKIIISLQIILIMFILAGCDIELAPVVPTPPIDDSKIETFDRLFNDASYKTLTIEISKDEWEDLDQVMLNYYQQFGNFRTDAYARANLIFEDSEGEVRIEDIGFRTRGNLSRTRIVNDNGDPQLSHFKISFHETFDIDYSKRQVFDVEELDLKYNRNWDEAYITEKFSLGLFQSYGVYAAETTMAKLYIKIGDSTYFYGLYTIFEPIDQLFLEKRIGEQAAEGDLYKALWQNYGPANLSNDYHSEAIGIKNEATGYRPAYDLKTNKKTSNHESFKAFLNDINLKYGSVFKTYIEDNFEVEMFLKLLAVGVLLGNPDDYRAMGNNYYFYQNDVTHKWGMIPYDYDHGMGQGWDGAPVFSNWSVGMDIYTWGNLNEAFLGIEDYPHVLVDKILSIPEYQLLYEGYLAELIDPSNDLFDPEVFTMIYESQRVLYSDGLESAMQSQPFGLRNVITYMNDKILDIQNQLTYYQSNPDER